MRKYRASYDDGHDYGEFEYYSNYRKNSRKNLEDMKREYKQQHGYTRYKEIKKFSCIGKIDD